MVLFGAKLPGVIGEVYVFFVGYLAGGWANDPHALASPSGRSNGGRCLDRWTTGPLRASANAFPRTSLSPVWRFCPLSNWGFGMDELARRASGPNHLF